MSNLNGDLNKYLFEYLLRLGDDLLIIGHRLSEWCGYAPILEEDIALGNIALDCIGQASAFLQFAAEVENKGRTEDDLAYFRDAIDYRNLQLTELPKGDFAFTIARQFLFDTYFLLLTEKLQKSSNEKLAGISAKSFKETKYHYRHSAEWMLRLGDGTEESNRRLQNAIDELWIYTGEIFEDNELIEILSNEKITIKNSELKESWSEKVRSIFERAKIKIPETNFQIKGSRKGIHSEHLGHLLAEMQILARSFPGAKW